MSGSPWLALVLGYNENLLCYLGARGDKEPRSKEAQEADNDDGEEGEPYVALRPGRTHHPYFLRGLALLASVS